MGYKHLNYNNDQIELLRKYYPNQQWGEIFKIFPEYNKKQIQKIAYQFGIKSNNPTRIKDITGQKFGELTVLSFSRITEEGAYWNCLCSCGKECEKMGSYLRAGAVKSCGHLQLTNRFKYMNENGESGYKDKTGNRYGSLVVKQMLPNYFGKGKTGCLCECDCGNNTVISSAKLGEKNYKKNCGKCPKYIIKNQKKERRKEDAQKRIYIVYKHTSPIGKHYIGITKQSLENRTQNGNGYSNQKKFYNAIKKYGWNNFTHEILETNLTSDEALKREEYYIKKYNSQKNGYNVSSSGPVAKAYGREILQLDKNFNIVNIFISESEIGSILGISYKTVAKWAKRNELINGYFWLFSDTYDKNIDYQKYTNINMDYLKFDPYEYGREQSHIASKISGKTSSMINSKKVNQYTLNGKYIRTYGSVREACREYGTTVQAATTKRIGMAYGYQWRFYEGNTNDIDPYIPGKKKIIIKIDKDTNVVIAKYDSMTKACKNEKIHFSTLKGLCEKQLLFNNQYYFQYYTDYIRGK